MRKLGSKVRINVNQRDDEVRMNPWGGVGRPSKSDVHDCIHSKGQI